jgi:nicotinate-nucleotide pyrophosphorylase (carboxylating)
MEHPDRHLIVELINRSLEEDIGNGDITSRATLEPGQTARAVLVAKEDLILCGIWVFEKTFEIIEPAIDVTINKIDGDFINKGTEIAIIEGLTAPILSAERTALNFMQRMCGIANLTHRFVEVVKGTKAVILDTRKTVPGFRILDKYAVVIGGGKNHRYGLYDMVLIKENHIKAAGGISKAVNRVVKKYQSNYKIEVEVSNLKELKEVLKLPVDRILLDNMSIEETAEAVQIASGKIPLEASGNVSLENVRRIAESGVDFISVGSLTHSAKAADLSLLVTLPIEVK